MDNQFSFSSPPALHSNPFLNPFLHKWKYLLNICLFTLVAFLAIFLGITAYHKGQYQRYENEIMMKNHVLCIITPQDFVQAGFPVMKLSNSSSNINNNQCEYDNALKTITLILSRLSGTNADTMQYYTLYAHEILKTNDLSSSNDLHITKTLTPFTIHSKPALLLEVDFTARKYNHKHQLSTLPLGSMCLLFTMGIQYELELTPQVSQSPPMRDSHTCTVSLVELVNKVGPSLSQ